MESVRAIADCLRQYTHIEENHALNRHREVAAFDEKALSQMRDTLNREWACLERIHAGAWREDLPPIVLTCSPKPGFLLAKLMGDLGRPELATMTTHHNGRGYLLLRLWPDRGVASLGGEKEFVIYPLITMPFLSTQKIP